MILTHDQAKKSLKKWKSLYIVSLLLPVLSWLIYIGVSLTSEPTVRQVLLNHFGAVYREEDLTKTTISEGEVKQFLAETLVTTFEYDYLGFTSPDRYKSYLTGKVDSDIPDHRDKIRPFYSNAAHKNVVRLLEREEWMKQSIQERRLVRVAITSPPVRKSAGQDFYMGDDGRLNVGYDGFIYVSSRSPVGKTLRFRLDYDVELERRTVVPEYDMPEYFFGPLVKDYNHEWRIKSISWKTSRRR
jgi:hypothetical protein